MRSYKLDLAQKVTCVADEPMLGSLKQNKDTACCVVLLFMGVVFYCNVERKGCVPEGLFKNVSVGRCECGSTRAYSNPA